MYAFVNKENGKPLNFTVSVDCYDDTTYSLEPWGDSYMVYTNDFDEMQKIVDDAENGVKYEWHEHCYDNPFVVAIDFNDYEIKKVTFL